MKLLLASHNHNKLLELKLYLSDHPDYEILTLDEVGIYDDVEETGSSFKENALIKARWAFQRSGLISLADDSGLEIRALHNEPGIYSARYLGKRMQDHQDRFAQFTSVVAIVYNESLEEAYEGIMPGSISIVSKGINGFGYDPIFIPEGQDLSYAEMSSSHKNSLSHRGKAFRKAIKALNERLKHETF
jgi:XTP/dITP diphosphohydrolase